MKKAPSTRPSSSRHTTPKKATPKKPSPSRLASSSLNAPHSVRASSSSSSRRPAPRATSRPTSSGPGRRRQTDRSCSHDKPVARQHSSKLSKAAKSEAAGGSAREETRSAGSKSGTPVITRRKRKDEGHRAAARITQVSLVLALACLITHLHPHRAYEIGGA